MSRDDFDGLLGAMVQAGLIEIEDAEFEKNGEVMKFRKVRLTEAGRELRAESHLELLISDGIVEEFGSRIEAPARTRKMKSGKIAGEVGAANPLTENEEALIVRIKEWRAMEAKRLGVPAYVVMHDRTVIALARMRPKNPHQLLAIDGMGPAKVERFGEAILELCGASR